ncbi:hypothetical protein, partial [Kitasatospora sp. NPDC004289]
PNRTPTTPDHHTTDPTHNPDHDRTAPEEAAGHSSDGESPPPPESEKNDTDRPRRPVGDLIPDGSGGNLSESQLRDGLQQALDREYGEFRVQVTQVFPGPDNLGWDADIIDRDGNRVGRMERTFHRNDNGDLVVKHEILKIFSAENQGKGFGSAFSRDLESWYRDSGVKEIRLTAGKENGGYTWARRDYRWADEKAAKRIFERLKAKLRDADPPPTAEEAAAAADIMNRSRRPFGSDGYPTPNEIAMVGAGGDAPFGQRVLVGSSWEGVKTL